jgi:hypothetical protein
MLELSVPVPSEVLPSKKVTVPVAALGDTVAVNVTLVPTTTEVPDAVSVTVLAWVPPDRFKKGMPPHPESASIGAVSTARRIRLLLPLPRVFDLILCTFERGLDLSLHQTALPVVWHSILGKGLGAGFTGLIAQHFRKGIRCDGTGKSTSFFVNEERNDVGFPAVPGELSANRKLPDSVEFLVIRSSSRNAKPTR